MRRGVTSLSRRLSPLLRVLGVLLLLPLFFGAGRALEWKEMEGELIESPKGTSADGKPRGLMRENMRNQSCAGEDTLDVTVALSLHNGTDQELIIDEEGVFFIVDGERHDIRQETYEIGEEKMATPFRRIKIQPKKTGEVKLTSHGFLATTELETANTIEVVIPSDQGKIRAMFSGLSSVVPNKGGAPKL